MEPSSEHDVEQRSAVSLPVVAAALVIALIAGAALAWVLINRDDEETLTAAAAIEELDLAAPLFSAGDPSSLVHLILDPVREGENTLEIRFTKADSGPEPVSVPMESVQVAIEQLTGEGAAQTIELQPRDDGSYAPENAIQLENGWWEFTVTVDATDEEPRDIRFYVLAPDPNVNGFDAVPSHDSDDKAQEVFEAGLQRWATMQSLKYIERLSSGVGEVAVAQREVTSGIDGNPAGFHLVSAQFELLTIGDRTWQRTPGSDWVERTTLEVFSPSAWPRLYTGATGFVLGKTVTINGRETQIVTFHVPATESLLAAWYAWWVDEETGYVIREAMISELHYMIYEFGEFDQPIHLEPPPSAATPGASPVDSPVASPSPA